MTDDGICVFENNFHEKGVSCNQNYCSYTDKLNFRTCLPYISHQVTGRVLSNNQCIVRGENINANVKSICKKGYCRLVNQYHVSCVDVKDQFYIKIIGISKAGDCVLDLKQIKNAHRLSQGVICSENECFDGITCIPLGSNQNSLSKLIDQSCAPLNTENSMSCFQNYPACLDQNNTCQLVSNINLQSIGNTQQGLCVQINQSYKNIGFCSSQYCIQEQSDLTFSCVPFDGSPQAIGIDQQGYCLTSTKLAHSCFNSKNVCQDPLTKFCIDISQSDNICAINGICYTMSLNQIPQYIGRDKNYLCLQNSQVSPQNLLVDKCLNIPSSICQKSDQTQCILYNGSTTYLGYISGTGYCAQLGQSTSLTQYQNIINLSQSYCQDNNFIIQQVNPQFQGRYQQYQICISTLQSQNNLSVEFCISGYCISSSNSCKQIGFDGVYIAKLADGTCGIAQQATAIQCGCINCDVCFYNFQSCYFLQDQGITSGVDTLGNCLNAGTYVSNLLKCQEKYCLKKNQSGQLACFSIDGLSGQFGIDNKGYCLNINQSGAVKCTQKTQSVCYDQDKQMCVQTLSYGVNQNGCNFNSICYQLSLQQFIGRDKKYNCLLSQQSSPQNSLIDKCLNLPNSICYKSDQTQCILYTGSTTYLGYIEGTGYCAQVGQSTSLTQYQNILNLSQNYCQDSSFVIQQTSPQFLGRYLQYQMCIYSQQPQNNLTIEFCSSGYCLYNSNSCKQIGFDGVYISKLVNGTCGNAFQTIAIQCGCLNCDVCLYNSQSCYFLKDSSITSGIDTNGNCLNVGTYTSNLLKCQSNYCIKNNLSGQSACFLIDGSPGQVGVDDKGNCLDANMPGAIKCSKTSSICYEQANQMCVYYHQNQNGCILNFTCQQFSLQQNIGKDKNFQCLLDQQNIDGTQVDICMDDPDQVCKSSDQMRCVLYRNSNVYLGYIQQTGICAQFNQKTSTISYQTVLNLNQIYCQNSDFVIQNIQPQFVGRDGVYQKCLVDSQISAQVEFCIQSYCLAADNSCKKIGFDGVQIAKLQNQQCSTDSQNNSIECAFINYDVCLLNQVCYWLSYSNINTAGIDIFGNCIQREVFIAKQNIKKCEIHHCLVLNLNNAKCTLIDGINFAGKNEEGLCLTLNQSIATVCTIFNSYVCFDQTNKYCTLTTTFGTQGGCSLNGNCYPLSSTQYIGRGINQQCLTSLQQASDNVDICFNDTNSICFDQINHCCVNYTNSAFYLGYIIENKQCAVNNQITYQLGVIANVKNLHQNYCQDTNGFIRQLDGQLNVGVDSNMFKCLIPNQQADSKAIQCYEGYCVSNNSCQLYNQIMIGRDPYYNCLSEGQQIAIQCSTAYACLDTVLKACFKINDTNANHSGMQTNGQCVVSGQYYQSIFKCSYNYCKQKLNPSDPKSFETCLPFDASQQRIGIDSNGYCVQQDIPNAIRCMEGQFCLNQQNGNSCQSLLFSHQEKRFARQKYTNYCLPYLNQDGKGDSIETCVQGSCLYTYPISGKDYCFTEGGQYFGYFIVGTDIQGYCIIENEVSNIQIATCYGITYCILTIRPGIYKCQKLSEPLPSYPNLIFRAKNVNQTCQDINTINSIGCLDGHYCLDISSNQCVKLNPDKMQNIGRNASDQKCIPQGVTIAIQCAQSYCIKANICIPLSIENPGKELNTDYCLHEKMEGKFGVSDCFKYGFCSMKNSITNLRSCYKLDYNNQNTIGIEKDTQQCIPQNQSVAVMCAIQRYCLDIQTQQCKYIDAKKNMCVDQFGKCATYGQCFSCNIDQCLAPDLSCQNLISGSNIYCTNNLGQCSQIQYGGCIICPDEFCMVNSYCFSSLQLLNQIKLNQCFQIDEYKKCLLKTIDQTDSNGNNFCSNNKGFCQNLSVSNDQCLQCPQYYTNPGNQKCYSIDQKYSFQSNKQQVYFQMKLTYVKQDCYDQNYCQSNIKSKCQTGCYSCSSQNICTQCVEGYFLFQESTINQICIQCPNIQYQYNDLKQYYKNIPTYRCLDCSSDYGLWNKIGSNYRTCTNYIILLDNVLQIVNNNLHATNFILNNKNGQYSLSALDISTCSKDCFSCMQISSLQAVCLQCMSGYILSNGVCQPCPNQCIKCSYATLIQGFITLLNQQNVDSSQIYNGNIIIICLQCQINYLVSYNLQYCTQCGDKCNYCQYGEDCVNNIQNCERNTIVVNNGSQIKDISSYLWSFVSPSSSFTFQYQCKKCNSGYSLINQNQCDLIGCQSINQCNSCIYIKNQNVCQYCLDGNVLSNLQNPPNCQNDICSQNIYNCSECYLYLDSQQGINFYQCTKCIDQNSTPSFYGCIKCPIGCSSCYEGTREFNLTHSIIYDKNFYTLQQRLDYNKDNKYSLYCTQCLDGYFFDQQQKLCLPIQCGQYCLLCKLINNKPQCMQCNYEKLQALISKISYFIGKLYFNQNYILDFNSMVTITASSDDCQICPIMCETCINNNDLNINPLYLYDSQCLSCKKSYGSNPDLLNYKITYDKVRRKCYLCNNSEQGCFYKKQRVIYTQCLDAESSLGIGTQSNPINYNKLNEINFDQLILDEINYNQAIVYYNELQVKQLEVQIIFLGELCVESKHQTLVTTLKDQVRSLETAILNITTLNSNLNKTMTFQQQDAIRIQGFDQINIQGILFQQSLSMQDIGFVASDKNLSSFNLFNCSFSQFLQKNLSKQYLIINLSTLQQSTIIFKDVSFQNIQILNQQQLIQINNTFSNSSVYIKFDSVQFNHVTFSNSKMVKLNFKNSTLDMSNLIFTQSTIEDQTLLLDIQQNSLQNQYVRILFDNITFFQSYFFNKSQILNSNFLNQLSINNMAFNQCSFSQILSDTNPLIISNQFDIKGFQIESSQINQYNFFQQVDSLFYQKGKKQQYSFSNIFIQNNKFNLKNNFLLLLSTQLSTDLTLEGIFLKQNIFQDKISSSLIQLMNLGQVLISNITTIDNTYFIVFSADNCKSVFLSNVFQKQNNDQLISPQICQLSQIQNKINLVNITQENIIISSNIIQIQNSFQKLNSNPLQIQILNYNSTQTKLLYYNVTQNCALVAITSKLNSYLNLTNINFKYFGAIPLIKQNQIGQISYGIYFNSPNLIADVLKSNFTDLQQNSQFNWISGFLKQITFDNCQFQNDIQNFNLNNLVYGGFFKLSSEQLNIKNSFFINGNAFCGGAFYWVSQNKGGLYLHNCIFLNNTASNTIYSESSGGAVYIDGLQSFSQDVLIEKSTFSNNFALFYGGALQIKTTISPRSVVQIQYSQFNDNLSIKGSIINVDSSKISQTAIIFQNITCIVNINNVIQLTLPFKDQLIEQLKQGVQNQASLISINDVYEVQIMKSYFQISSKNFQQQVEPLIIYLVYQKILLITNVQFFNELSNIYEGSLFFGNLITLKQIKKIQIVNITIKNNKSIQMPFQITTQNENLAIYNSQECIITLSQINSNICQTCSQGILNIVTNYLYIQNTTFDKNIAMYGSALFLEQAQNGQVDQMSIQYDTNNFQIIRSQFSNNLAQNSGGAIFINQSSLYIIQTVFENNRANLYGGAIFLENKDENILKRTLQISKSSFQSNQASMGGAIASTTFQGINYFSRNEFKFNKALLNYGQTIQASPTHIATYLNGKKQLNLKVLLIQNHQGGQLKDSIQFRLSNDQNEELLDFNSEETLQVTIEKGFGFINLQELRQNHGNFDLTKQIQIYGKRGQQLQLRVSSRLIKAPQYNQQEQIINYNNTYTFTVLIQFSQYCPVGYVVQQIHEKYDFCAECYESTYSLQVSDSCYSCPSKDVFCKGKLILLPSNLWRVNQNSSKLFDCKNCVGDLEIQRIKSSNLLLLQVKKTDLNYYCKEGYVGALCEDCDRSGQYWGDKYFLNLNQKCQNCCMVYTQLLKPNTNQAQGQSIIPPFKQACRQF
ncbi:hypothetical protein TTHERM_00488290 (macronuclear) [Tetrahymena thermophila SB210]|uniref:EGF-like domain-containing protein n=1 Tax=Tetrahymena thermophila (strain SB210) TaxID=312017 RepID=Q23JE5_TETTS|nr:hypothetical protein TTHERM_00488290 [Tetrahymena thermophila SB210]EAR96559.2 hypothetical protein TTHERM_00488290 [Tetrahymena thermophila SB210]|eukprot:XP_001016804.2 hypothetical protein TTHERM_00488290 [Tetrahymena thermophila SB210]